MGTQTLLQGGTDCQVSAARWCQTAVSAARWCQTAKCLLQGWCQTAKCLLQGGVRLWVCTLCLKTYSANYISSAATPQYKCHPCSRFRDDWFEKTKVDNTMSELRNCGCVCMCMCVCVCVQKKRAV